MPKYLAISDTWLSHENRLIKAGDEFETSFPNGPDGKPMKLSGNLKLVKAAPELSAAEKKAADIAAKEAAEKLADAEAALAKAKESGSDTEIAAAEAALAALQPPLV
jgi:hypothetical protein